MIQIVDTYETYLMSLPELISKSYYKAEYFMTNLGLKHATYYRKLRENSFTIKEVKKITELLYPEEVLLRSLQKGEEDIKAGKVKSHRVVMKNLRSQYGI
jgi:hypothetical protein